MHYVCASGKERDTSIYTAVPMAIHIWTNTKLDTCFDRLHHNHIAFNFIAFISTLNKNNHHFYLNIYIVNLGQSIMSFLDTWFGALFSRDFKASSSASWRFFWDRTILAILCESINRHNYHKTSIEVWVLKYASLVIVQAERFKIVADSKLNSVLSEEFLLWRHHVIWQCHHFALRNAPNH